ncbi:hypothetical protein FOMPIDRAFT_1056505 [Fomitopsis schrenkii]|uniref:Uncharacterized protein n=1 Tax=Fomitopsis schrenkii TaxID=2126942 RepID=S8ET03_FOMSC|nr:hypothetical protein FOMPIDRAFT_1056505 [Fomitopsis schrenkii]
MPIFTVPTTLEASTQKMVDLIEPAVSAQCFSGCWQDEAGKALAVYWEEQQGC